MKTVKALKYYFNLTGIYITIEIIFHRLVNNPLGKTWDTNTYKLNFISLFSFNPGHTTRRQTILCPTATRGG